MKAIILSINSKYIHTLLAPRYLKANCKDKNVEIIETNINIKIFDLLSEIFIKKPDIIAISCYIFNIEYTRRLLEEIKIILPDTIIILGGYEAAFDEARYLPLCNYLIKGEGDFIFNELLIDIEKNTKIYGKVIEAGTVKNLDDITSPFDEEYCTLGKEKILYLETSRGCPFCCSYCMSANTHGVRTFSLKRIFSDIDSIMKYELKQIKLVDRTFNFNIERAVKIFDYIVENYSDKSTNFHFEMAPELFNDKLFSVLEKAKKGLFQFEIGVQSYNEQTLKKVNRKADIEIIEQNLSKLIKMGNINIHVDLIAGLPDENYESFVKGFDRLFNLKPNCLQLGFLKILKGSHIYSQKNDFDISNYPPYEVINTPVLNFGEILKLKTAEEMLELYYNSGRFKASMNFLIPKYFSPYLFFYEIGNYLKEKKLDKKGFSAFYQCEILYSFIKEKYNEDKELLLNLQNIINNDFAESGNTRKWRKQINI